MSEYEVRRLPKKTIVYIVILVLLGVVGFFIIMQSKEAKAQKILYELGYKNVSEITVFAEHPFLNEETNVKGKQYSLEFTNNDNGNHCRGFIFKDFKRNVMKDLECK